MPQRGGRGDLGERTGVADSLERGGFREPEANEQLDTDEHALERIDLGEEEFVEHECAGRAGQIEVAPLDRRSAATVVPTLAMTFPFLKSPVKLAGSMPLSIVVYDGMSCRNVANWRSVSAPGPRVRHTGVWDASPEIPNGRVKPPLGLYR